MASLRNAVKRKTHKERAQPSDRRQFGLLEKHKDYVLRARDFHRKEDHLQLLKEKAAFRNPDEFYFKMEHTRTKNGIHVKSQGGAKYSQEELKLMKTQDVRYVQAKAQAEAKKVERLRAALQGIGERAPNKHVVFKEKGESERPRAVRVRAGLPDLQPLPPQVERRRESAYRELREREERAGQMSRLVAKMAMQKELMGKGSKRKMASGGTGGDGDGKDQDLPMYKWKKERKR